MYKRAFVLIMSITSACLFPLRTKTVFAENEVSKAECVMELHSRRILYQAHGDVRLPMASTTKIVTAATVLAHCEDIRQTITVPSQAAGIEGSSVYLQAGDTYTVEDLLYGLMLRSGNDCAAALAYHISGSIPDFACKMNELAERAGALDSHFQNPHGLPCKGHYTTAKDLTAIACYALQNEVFRRIVSTTYYSPQGWKNKNKLLYQYPGAIGVKTGYTKEAGRCLVSAAERDGMTLVCTVLSCSPMYERSSKLLNDGFASYRYTTLLKEKESFCGESDGHCIEGYVKESFQYPLLKEEIEWIEYKTVGVNKGEKIKNDEEIVGQLEIYLAKRLLFSTNLYKL